jgi:predicted component of viral defense system (DUF524 family)
MKTLYDKLRPEYKTKLKEIHSKYPSTYKSLVEDLQSHYFWLDLTVSKASSLLTHVDPYKIFGIDALNNLFNNDID